MKRFLKANGLVGALIYYFFIAIIGMSITHHITSGSFGEVVFENWESEFLAVGVLLVLSIFLRERGSQQSKPVGRRYNQSAGD